jgi:hypothetical protein
MRVLLLFVFSAGYIGIFFKIILKKTLSLFCTQFLSASVLASVIFAAM